MLNMYLYCSYQGSPTGFVLKSVDIENLKGDDIAVIFEKKVCSDFIKQVLIRGGKLIKKAYGYIEPKWVYIVKNIDQYKSIAFEFDDYEKYKQYVNNLKNFSNEELINLMDSFIRQDNQDMICGYNINAEKLYEFKFKLESKSEEINCSNDERTSCIITSDYEISKDILESKLEMTDYLFIAKSKGIIVCKKKQLGDLMKKYKKNLMLFLSGLIISMVIETFVIITHPGLFNKKIGALEKENKMKTEKITTLEKKSELMIQIIDENPAIKKDYEERLIKQK